jgi:hypothetical protein
MNGIEMIINKANQATTQTEFLKSIQFNDRFGCITLEDETRWYPELQNGTKVSVFLKDMYKSVKAMIQEGNEAIQEIIEETPTIEVVEVIEEVVNVEVKEVLNTNNVQLTNNIIKALDYAGYDCEPTEYNLIECFRDYVDSGIWSNLDLEEADDMIASNELTVKQMCNAIIRYCRKGA